MECLNKYYYELDTITEHNIYIYNDVLKQIANSDESFCNSFHTQNILYSKYGIKTNLFYSNFVNYYSKKIEQCNDFENRKYNYAFITSNFDRKIKNVEATIKFLMSKSNVIIVGKKSSKYRNYGFECRENLTNKEIGNILKDTKYVVQDSFYESCSNVKIEALFNGCIVIRSHDDIK